MFIGNGDYSITPLGFDDPSWGPVATLLHPSTMEKLAENSYTPDRLTEFMANLRPRIDGRYILLNALGAGEFWGCFLPGSEILTDTGKYIPIERVRSGDHVLSHSGEFREVLRVWEHNHHTEGIEIEVEGLIDPIRTTLMHVFPSVGHQGLVCSRDTFKRCLPEIQGTQNICQRPQSVICSSVPKTVVTRWTESRKLMLKDFLLSPISEHDADPVFTDEEARVAGLWIADGNFINKHDGIEININQSESEIGIVADLLSFGFKKYQGHGNCWSMRLLDESFAHRLECFGEYAGGKYIPGLFSRQPEHVILSFLSGYFDGDGSQGPNSTAYACSVSKNLALGIQRLLWSVRIPSTTNPAPGAYHVHFSKDRGEKLAKLCKKFDARLPKGRSHYRQFFFENYVALPIRGLRHIDIDGPVYDLEVEEEHSYNVGQIACHNSNKNGDYFAEWSLKGDPPPPEIEKLVQDNNLPVPGLWGHRTFEMYAYPFRGHANKDPANSIGDRVCCSGYNDRMHRVELIVFISEAKAPDLVKRIDDGIPVAWSMGSKLLWDRCHICGHVSRNRAEYCTHLKNELNMVYPDGRKVFAYNDFPRFFDISEVMVPADRSAYSLKKVACDMELMNRLGISSDEERVAVPSGLEKYAGVIEYLESGGEDKAADINKEVPTQEDSKNLGSSPIAPEVWSHLFELAKNDLAEQPAMPVQITNNLKKDPISKILEAVTSLGILLKPEEVRSLTGGREDLLPDKLDFGRPDSTLLNVLKELINERSMLEPHFGVRIMRVSVGKPNKSSFGSDRMVKTSGAYEKYKKLLREGVSLEKLAEVMESPLVKMALNPEALEKQILNLRDPVISLHCRMAPFIAAIGQEL